MTDIIVLSVGIVISCISTFVILKSRPSEVQKWFILASVSIFIYMFANLTKRHTDQTIIVAFMQELIYVGTSLAYAGFVMGLSEVCEVRIPKKIRDYLISLLVFMCALFMTIHLHTLFYSEIDIFPDPNIEGLFIHDNEENWLYYVLVVGYANILLIAMVVFLLIGIVRKKGRKITVIRLLLISMILPVVPLFLRLAGIIPNAMADHVSFIINDMFMLYLIRHYDVMTTLPVIKEQAIETSHDGIVILDKDRYYQYANETARRIFPELGGDDPLKVTEFIASDLADGTKERDDRRYVVRTDKGTDGSDDSMKGYLVTIHDITEHDRRIRAEEEIKIAVEREKTAAEMSLAAKIQMSSMPHDFPPFPDRTEFDIYASMEPAKEVGGDFYDFFLIDDDHLCLVIADVSGKGVPASLYMMVTKVILQSCARLGRSPADILDKTNAAICSKNEMEMFITVWLGILEISTGKVIAANAGHEYPMISDGGAFRLFKDKHGLVIGGMDGVRYTEYEFTMEHGSKLFVYTDGIPEATDASNGMFGTDRLITALNSDLSAHPEQILNNVRSAVAGFVKDAEQFDDMTMLCIEYK